MLTVENAREIAVRWPCETAAARAIRSMIGDSATLPTMRRIYRWLWFRRSSFHPVNLIIKTSAAGPVSHFRVAHSIILISDEIFEKLNKKLFNPISFQLMIDLSTRGLV
jgi:hypothetical protein